MGHVDDIAQRWQDELLETHPQCAAFLCPIRKVLMLDPVTADDGYTYEREAIESWLETKDFSPMKRGGDGKSVSIGKQLEENTKMKAAIDRIRAGDRSGIVEWDSQSVDLDLPPPTASPQAAADVTSDLTKMFKILDPLRAELKSLANLTPPKIVVIGDESSGKSTVLEQLMRMPLFPRKQEFCTRLPIHVRLRRPDPASNEKGSVKMSVITAAAYARDGYSAEPEEPPVTIAIASGYHYVQARMDELSGPDSASFSTGIVTDRIIVLDVLHPEVPVLDLIDLPGIVAVDVTVPGKVAAVEAVISAQIKADEEHGMTSFYLIIVPSSKPNTNCALRYIQEKGLLTKAIGVLTKADEVDRPDKLRAWIKGGDVEDEDDGSVRTAAALGQVEIAKGWTATMLKMPKRKEVTADGKKVNYYLNAQLERLEKQKADEKLFFGGADANNVMRELYNEGLAGTGALAAKLNYEYYEYCRTEWLERTVTRLLQYELQLLSERALLGVTDSVTKDELAANEVARTIDDGAKALTQRFAHEVLGKLFPVAEAAVNEINKKEVDCQDLDSTLAELQNELTMHVSVAVEAVETFYADELKKMLDAPIHVSMSTFEPLVSTREDEDEDESEDEPFAPADGPLALRFWNKGAKMVRSLFGTAEALPDDVVELHKKVIKQSIIQLGAYPEYTSAIAAVVRDECVVSKKKIEAATAAVLKEVTSDVSQYLLTHPIEPLYERAEVFVRNSGAPPYPYFIIDGLKAAFVRHLPTPDQLKAVVIKNASLKLSNFEEDTQTAEKRDELNERLARVRKAMHGLVRALDVDKECPLDDAWFAKLKKEALNEPSTTSRANSFDYSMFA